VIPTPPLAQGLSEFYGRIYHWPDSCIPAFLQFVATLAAVVALHGFVLSLGTIAFRVGIVTLVFALPRIFLLLLLGLVLIWLQASDHCARISRRVEGVHLDFLIDEDLGQS
jgi:hypothetical protein